jgi:hypothetical protein
LAALALKVGDAFGFCHTVYQLVWQAQLDHQIRAKREQIFAKLLQFGTFAFEIGTGGFIRTFEFALVLQVQCAALGNELALDVIAFFEFA